MSIEPRENEQSLETSSPSGSDARARIDTPAPDPSSIATDSPETGDIPLAPAGGDAGAMAAGEPGGDADANAGGSPTGLPQGEGLASDNGVVEDETIVDADDDEDEEEEEEVLGHVEPIEEAAADPPPEEMEFRWYILKVQVNREDSICEALQRRIARAGLDPYFGEIVVPTEDVVEFNKNGKKRTVKRKLYPGYIIVNMALTEETWFLVRETPGIGDFTGSAGKPTPMDPDEVRRIIKPKGEVTEGVEEVRIAIPFNVGDRVRVKEGYFQNFEGDVESIDNANGRVTVMINIFGRSTPVELQHWQMERV